MSFWIYFLYLCWNRTVNCAGMNVKTRKNSPWWEFAFRKHLQNGFCCQEWQWKINLSLQFTLNKIEKNEQRLEQALFVNVEKPISRALNWLDTRINDENFAPWTKIGLLIRQLLRKNHFWMVSLFYFRVRI